MKRFYRRLLRWLQKKCDHSWRAADILQGDVPNQRVVWCKVCGAYQHVYKDSPHLDFKDGCRMPEPHYID